MSTWSSVALHFPCSIVEHLNLTLIRVRLNHPHVCLSTFMILHFTLLILLIMQFAAKNLLQRPLCVLQHLCYYPGGHHNCPSHCTVQHPVVVCSSGISDVLHAGSRVPLTVEVSGKYCREIWIVMSCKAPRCLAFPVFPVK